MKPYTMINWFFMYSFLGYLLECTVLSIEYRRPVVDRGFGHGPFCVIYGFGALGAMFLLTPVAGEPGFTGDGTCDGCGDDSPVRKFLVGLQHKAF